MIVYLTAVTFLILGYLLGTKKLPIQEVKELVKHLPKRTERIQAIHQKTRDEAAQEEQEEADRMLQEAGTGTR